MEGVSGADVLLDPFDVVAERPVAGVDFGVVDRGERVRGSDGRQGRDVAEVVLGPVDVARISGGECCGVGEVVEDDDDGIAHQPNDGIGNAVGGPRVDLGHVVHGIVVDHPDTGSGEASGDGFSIQARNAEGSTREGLDGDSFQV